MKQHAYMLLHAVSTGLWLAEDKSSPSSLLLCSSFFARLQEYDESGPQIVHRKCF